LGVAISTIDMTLDLLGNYADFSLSRGTHLER
jgi:hypothetical protein